MKTDIRTLLSLVLLLSFMSCNKKDEKPITPEVVLSETSFNFSHEGGSNNLTITTNTFLEIKGTNEEWYSITSGESNTANTQIFIIT